MCANADVPELHTHTHTHIYTHTHTHTHKHVLCMSWLSKSFLSIQMATLSPVLTPEVILEINKRVIGIVKNSELAEVYVCVLCLAQINSKRVSCYCKQSITIPSLLVSIVNFHTCTTNFSLCRHRGSVFHNLRKTKATEAHTG